MAWKTCGIVGCRVKEELADARIELPDGFFQGHLCPKHLKPLAAFREPLGHHFIKVRPGTDRRRFNTKFRIHTIEEIEEMKLVGETE